MTNLLEVPVLWCDIDGTIRWGKDELGRFVNTKDDVRVFDEVPDLLLGYKALGWRIIGASNQGGIALGHMTMDDCFAAMAETQRQCENAFDKIVFCAHSPYDNPGCPCRKPKIGMIIQTREWLSQNHGELYPNHLGLVTGDRPEDEMMAANANIPYLLASRWREGHHLRRMQSEQ